MQTLKACLEKYKHGWILSYFFIYLIWFFYLEQRTDTEHHSIHIFLDDWIPFCEYFIIPYYLWFAFIVVTVLYFFFTNTSDYYKCCAFLFIGMTICLIIYTIYPNEQNLRPATFSRDNFFTSLVQSLYSTDTNTNVCPSIHCFNSMGAWIAIWKNQRLKKHPWIVAGSLLLCISICLSTVFLKQHSAMDGFCAFILAVFMYILVYKVDYSCICCTLRKKSDKSASVS